MYAEGVKRRGSVSRVNGPPKRQENGVLKLAFRVNFSVACLHFGTERKFGAQTSDGETEPASEKPSQKSDKSRTKTRLPGESVKTVNATCACVRRSVIIPTSVR